VSVPVLTILTNALDGHNVYGPGEPVKAADAAYCLGQLNLILDDWNADGQSSLAEVFTEFVTTASLQPHTIGPTGVWVLPVRPVAIAGAALLAGTSDWTPIAVTMDPQAWQRRGALGTSLTWAYYAATVPNGEIYFDGIPAGGETVRLMTRTVLASVLIGQALTLAPGYESALTLTLQEKIAGAFHATVSADLTRDAGKARARIWANNLRIPSLSVAGLGLPGLRGDGRAQFPMVSGGGSFDGGPP
jgi:hypothetical protein